VRLLAGIVKGYAPDTRLAAGEVYPPPDSVTVPVGMAPPLVEAATVTATLRAVVALRVEEAGVTVTVGVGGGMTVTVAVPEDAA
jgi:hypothetical protein